jgi:hypothetical protein
MRIASILATASLAFVVTSVAACSSSGNAGTSSPFDGTWSCAETDVLTYTTPPGSAAQTLTGKASLLVTEATNGDITLTPTTDAGTTCALNSTASGSTATLVANQTCKSGALSFDYTQGTTTVSGSSLTSQLSFTFTGSVSDDGGAVSVGGTGITSYTCTK